MTALLVLRHGPTDWNRSHRLQGRCDQPLSDAGRAMVRTWRVPEESIGWHSVASPLARCVETARLLGWQPTLEPRLIEMDWGQWEGRTAAALRAELGATFAAAEASGLDLMPPGGESPRQVQARLRPWLAGITRPTIAVTHKGVLRALLALATGWAMTGPPPLKLRDFCAHRFDVAAGQVTVSALNLDLGGETVVDAV
ncbi:MAG: histidine phosphatase family protein [Azospirillaceae bacterium]|nr:histidine phosphatase family protein [Azospirillaceae bacterium]